MKRTKLVEVLKAWDGRHYQLFTMLATKNKYARRSFNRMYNQKPFELWTEEDKQNTLGYMMGYNVIQG